jgi:cell division protein FtsI/penicillin-binding protein 2
MKPQIIEKNIYPDGRIEEVSPQEIRRVIKKETAEKLSQMLRSVVENGHGKKAAVSGYLVGGKTGTAQVAKTGEKGYEEGIAVGSFVGFAPIEDPQFTVLVKIYNPKDVQWAESTAAPAFSRVMKFL